MIPPRPPPDEVLILLLLYGDELPFHLRWQLAITNEIDPDRRLALMKCLVRSLLAACNLMNTQEPLTSLSG